MRSREVTEGHMALSVGHRNVDNNHLHPNLHNLVRSMVRNIHHLRASNMDGYIRQDEDEKRYLLGNVTGPHTFLKKLC